MQKVSNQSLAMLALSILLAISIALTATFAALGDSKTATGTITFSGAYAITMTGVDNTDATDNWTFSGTIDGEGKISLPSDPTVTFKNISAGSTMYYSIKVAGTEAVALTSNTVSETSTEASVEVKLSTLVANATIDWDVLNTQVADGGYKAQEFVVTIKVGNAASDVTIA